MTQVPLELFIERFPLNRSDFLTLLDNLNSFKQTDDRIGQTDQDFVDFLHNFLTSDDDSYDDEVAAYRHSLLQKTGITINEIVDVKEWVFQATEDGIFPQTLVEDNPDFFRISGVSAFYESMVIGQLIIHRDQQLLTEEDNLYGLNYLEAIVASNRFDLFNMISNKYVNEDLYPSALGSCSAYNNYQFFENLVQETALLKDFGIVDTFDIIMSISHNFEFLEQCLKLLIQIDQLEQKSELSEGFLTSLFIRNITGIVENLVNKQPQRPRVVDALDVFDDVVENLEPSNSSLNFNGTFGIADDYDRDDNDYDNDDYDNDDGDNVEDVKQDLISILDLASRLSLSGIFVLNDVIYTSIILMANQVIPNTHRLLQFKIEYNEKVLAQNQNIQLDVDAVQSVIAINNLKPEETCFL